MRKLTFLGYFLGWSLYTLGSLNLELPKAFWKRICGGVDYVYTLEDLHSQDTILAKSLESIRVSASTLTKEDFSAAYGDYFFVLETGLSDDQVIELLPGGKTLSLTQANAEEYIDLYL